jgi:hypothetical protein
LECFLLCWFTGGLFLCLAPFLCGKIRDPSSGSLLSACYGGLLIVLLFCNIVLTLVVAHWLRRWALWTAIALFQAVAYHLPTVGLPAFSVCFTVSWHGDQLLAPLPFSGAL